MDSKKNEARLVARAVEGDAEAFGDLYEIHLDAIYRYVYYRTSNHQDAEDLTETVFLKAWRAIGRYQVDSSPFRAWLYRIAHNAVVDHYRAYQETEPLALHPTLSDDGGHVEQQIQRREWTDRLNQVIGRLSPLHQDVLVLRFINGLSHAEVAEILERSAGSVRVLQHRALKELEALLAVEDSRHA